MKNIFIDQGVQKFIKSLDKLTKAKIIRVIDLLEKFGHQIGMPHSKKVRNNLFELRVRGKLEIRLFYMFWGNDILLFMGLLKNHKKYQLKKLILS